MYSPHFFLLVKFVICGLCVDNSLCGPTTRLFQGPLLGSWMTTRGGRSVAAFEGIPYARPPVKELRFQSPQPANPWVGVKLALNNGPMCVQYEETLGLIIGDEDCLYLNVYTPSVRGSYPVLFFIHGGYYKSGSASTILYGPKFLLDEDIVLVTIQYRLGAFGFLSLEDPALPGNMGLKDQRAALRWVRDNIAQFGGDPASVTIFGQSAGAKSAHLQMLFNEKERLFRAGILHSGSAFTGAYQRPGEQRPLVEYLLNETKCAADDKSAVVQCLRKVQPYRLTRIVENFFPQKESLKDKIELAPVIEPDCVEDAIVTEDPWTRTTSLPIIVGSNEYEGLYALVALLKNRSDKNFEKFDRNFEDIIPYNLMFDFSAEDPLSVAESLRAFYLQDRPINRDNVLRLVNMVSDGLYKYGVTEAVKHNLNKTYLYSFNYLGTRSILTLSGYENNFGPAHVDELFMFFPLLLIPPQNLDVNKAAETKLLSTQMIKLWTNFITHLKPTLEGSSVEWTPVSGPGLQNLDIRGPNNFTMEPEFLKERMEFWSNLPFRNKPLTSLPPCGL